MVQPPKKHIVDNLINIPAANTSVQILTLAVGTFNPNYVTNSNNVKAGSKIAKMLLQIDAVAYPPNDANSALIFDWFVCFNIAGAQTFAAPNSAASDTKTNQIFHQEQGILSLPTALGGVPPPYVMRLSIDIPKSWQILNDLDTIELHIAKNVLVSAAFFFKVKAIYKEIYP